MVGVEVGGGGEVKVNQATARTRHSVQFHYSSSNGEVQVVGEQPVCGESRT